jgi:hypothetical protein
MKEQTNKTYITIYTDKQTPIEAYKQTNKTIKQTNKQAYKQNT